MATSNTINETFIFLRANIYFDWPQGINRVEIDALQWIIDLLCEKQKDCPKILIFVRYDKTVTKKCFYFGFTYISKHNIYEAFEFLGHINWSTVFTNSLCLAWRMSLARTWTPVYEI